MIGILAFVVRVVLLAGFTFGFVVLFEHGPAGFAAGAPVELDHFESFLVSLKNRGAEEPAPEPAPVAPVESAAAAPVVPATPIPVSAPPSPPKPKGPPSAWEQLQSKPIGEGIDAPLATPFPADPN
jgi:hypothetical protein